MRDGAPAPRAILLLGVPFDLEPLLAALTGPQVLVTSRNSFARPPGAGRSDWSQVEVSPLPVPDSVALLRALAPAAPLAEQPQESRRLVELCGGLPLDLVLTGARLAETPEWTLADQVRRDGSLTLEDAVRRMTSASLARFGITDRGRLAKGQAADVVVFDPDTIADSPPGPRRPAGRPVGIEHVFVNGTEVVRGGARLGDARAGRVLRT